MIRKEFFETPLWISDISLNNKLLIEILEECIKQKYTDTKSSINGAIQTLNLLNVNNFFHTKKTIEELFLQETGKEVTVKNAWICKNPKGSKNKTHVHGGCDISGVYYIKVPKNSGNIIFHNPNQVVQTQELYDKDKCFSQIWYINSEENKIMFFPSWVPHETQENKAENDRIALSFNIVYN